MIRFANSRSEVTSIFTRKDSYSESCYRGTWVFHNSLSCLKSKGWMGIREWTLRCERRRPEKETRRSEWVQWKNSLMKYSSSWTLGASLFIRCEVSCILARSPLPRRLPMQYMSCQKLLKYFLSWCVFIKAQWFNVPDLLCVPVIILYANVMC